MCQDMTRRQLYLQKKYFSFKIFSQLFNNVKPFLIRDSKAKITQEIDDNIDKMIGKYGLIPNSLSPIDYIIAEARRMVREK